MFTISDLDQEKEGIITISNLKEKKEEDVIKEVLSVLDMIEQKNVMLISCRTGEGENISEKNFFNKPIHSIKNDLVKRIKKSLPDNTNNKITILEEEHALLLILYTGRLSGTISIEYVYHKEYDAVCAEIKASDLPQKTKSHYLKYLKKEADCDHYSLKNIQRYFESEMYTILHHALNYFQHELNELQTLQAQNALERIMEAVQDPNTDISTCSTDYFVPLPSIMVREAFRDMVTGEYQSEDRIVFKMMDSGKVLYELIRETIHRIRVAETAF